MESRDEDLMNQADEGGLVRSLWLELERTQDLDCREYILERLGEAALDLHDFSDLEISEDVHRRFEGLRKVREDYHLIAMKVGRFVAQMLDEHEARARAQAHADDPSAN